MSKSQIIDVHCHLFNAKYAVKELIAVSWNSLRGNYPHRSFKRAIEEKRTIEKRGIFETIEGAAEYIAYVARLLKVATQDCNGNHTYMHNEFEESNLGYDKEIISVPLMMDIYYALDNNKSDADAAVKRGIEDFDEDVLIIGSNEVKDFNEHLDDLKGLIRKELEQEKDARFERTMKRSADDALDSIFHDVKSEISEDGIQKRGVNKYPGIEMSPGFREHMEALIKLEENNKGKVFPFLAVDPRRRGILKLIIDTVSKKGPFYGIKLYPPLGYHPTHPVLVEIFDHCVKYDIPITVHTSKGGVQNFRKKNYVLSTESGVPKEINDKDKSAFYANPKNWETVLEKWKELRINFAHFGGSEQYINDEKDWMMTIQSVLKNSEYPNVYTDLSYYLKTGLMDTILSTNNEIKKKIMFGTDYIMIMLDSELGGLKEYFNNFGRYDEDFHYGNAKRFLGAIKK